MQRHRVASSLTGKLCNCYLESSFVCDSQGQIFFFCISPLANQVKVKECSVISGLLIRQLQLPMNPRDGELCSLCCRKEGPHCQAHG